MKKTLSVLQLQKIFKKQEIFKDMMKSLNCRIPGAMMDPTIFKSRVVASAIKVLKTNPSTEAKQAIADFEKGNQRAAYWFIRAMTTITDDRLQRISYKNIALGLMRAF